MFKIVLLFITGLFWCLLSIHKNRHCLCLFIYFAVNSPFMFCSRYLGVGHKPSCEFEKVISALLSFAEAMYSNHLLFTVFWCLTSLIKICTLNDLHRQVWPF